WQVKRLINTGYYASGCRKLAVPLDEVAYLPWIAERDLQMRVLRRIHQFSFVAPGGLDHQQTAGFARQPLEQLGTPLRLVLELAVLASRQATDIQLGLGHVDPHEGLRRGNHGGIFTF